MSQCINQFQTQTCQGLGVSNPVAYFTEELNPSVAKPSLNSNGGLTTLDLVNLTSTVSDCAVGDPMEAFKDTQLYTLKKRFDWWL